MPCSFQGIKSLYDHEVSFRVEVKKIDEETQRHNQNLKREFK